MGQQRFWEPVRGEILSGDGLLIVTRIVQHRRPLFVCGQPFPQADSILPAPELG